MRWTSFMEPHPPFFPPKDIYARIDQSAIELPEQRPADFPSPHTHIQKRQQEWAHLTEVEIRQMIAGYYGMVHLVDGYCDLVGADIPESVQGRSLASSIENGKPDGEWCGAVFSQIGDSEMIRTETEKLNVYAGESGEYFNLAEDPKEFHNRIAEPVCTDRVRDPRSRLDQWYAVIALPGAEERAVTKTTA